MTSYKLSIKPPQGVIGSLGGGRVEGDGRQNSGLGNCLVSLSCVEAITAPVLSPVASSTAAVAAIKAAFNAGATWREH